VVLDNGCIKEAIHILETVKNSGVCYVGLKTNLKKYRSIKHKINKWVPKVKKISFYGIGHTGTQFITFNKKYFVKFMNAINNKQICTKIARGCKNFTGYCDSNLQVFNKISNVEPLQTVNNKLDHIGWETVIGLNDEYERMKNINLKTGKIRVNINIDQYKFTKL